MESIVFAFHRLNKLKELAYSLQGCLTIYFSAFGDFSAILATATKILSIFNTMYFKDTVTSKMLKSMNRSAKKTAFEIYIFETSFKKFWFRNGIKAGSLFVTVVALPWGKTDWNYNNYP